MALGGALAIEHAPYVYLHLACAVLLLSVLPGYAIAQALFAGRPRSLSQLSVLSIGLSLSVSILTALVLSLATNGLRTGSWLTVVVVIVLGADWAALRRRASVEPEATGTAAVPLVRVRLRVRDVILLVVAAAVVVGALLFARTPLPAKNVQGFTALSIVQTSTRTPPTVRVAVTSEEQETRALPRRGDVRRKGPVRATHRARARAGVERNRSCPEHAGRGTGTRRRGHLLELPAPDEVPLGARLGGSRVSRG